MLDEAVYELAMSGAARLTKLGLDNYTIKRAVIADLENALAAVERDLPAL